LRSAESRLKHAAAIESAIAAWIADHDVVSAKTISQQAGVEIRATLREVEARVAAAALTTTGTHGGPLAGLFEGLFEGLSVPGVAFRRCVPSPRFTLCATAVLGSLPLPARLGVLGGQLIHRPPVRNTLRAHRRPRCER
jgi:hypothetical protein